MQESVDAIGRWRGATVAAVLVVACCGTLGLVRGDDGGAGQADGADSADPVLTEEGLPGLPGGAGVAGINFGAHAVPVLEWYCMDCHGGGIRKGGVDLSVFADEDAMVREFKLWEKVVEQIESRTMPPMDADQPDEPTRQRLAGYLRHVLDSYDGPDALDPGPGTLRRLTHLEYNNTVRDLVGVDLRPAEGFPADAGGGEGFTNNAQTLFVSPLLMEKYLDAAQEIVEHAEVGFTNGLVFHAQPLGERDRLAYIDSADQALRGYLSAAYERAGAYQNDGDLVAQYAEHLFRFDHAKLSDPALTLAGYADAAGLRLDWLESFRRAQDGGQEKVAELWQRVPQATADIPIEEQLPPLRAAVDRLRELIEKDAQAVRRDLVDSQVKRAYVEQSSWRGLERLIFGFSERELRATLDAAELAELDRLFAEREARQRGSASAARQVAADVIETFASRAYRRPLTDAEKAALLEFYDGVAERSPTLEHGVRQTLRRVLMSPHFLFRVERPIAGDQPGRVDGYALASRLSYMLWASMPDEALLAAAGAGRLSDEAELERQVRRMLADAKSKGLAEQFVGQWLGLSALGGHARPDAESFPAYDAELGEAMLTESRLFFQALIREDRPVTDLFAADFTFVDRRLAGLYGIDPGVLDGQDADGFIRVEMAGTGRGGVLGMAGVHLLTSYPHRASPVLRGQWVLGALLGSPTPPPPPDVGELTEGAGHEGLTLREQLQIHRDNPTCAVCHDRLDPIGFALQGYDAIGRWMTEDAQGRPIDDRAVTPDGVAFAGPTGLRDYLLGRKDQFHRQAAIKALGYGLGREVEYYDRPALRRIEAALAEDPRFSTVFVEVAKSYAFTHRRGEAQQAQAASDR